MTVTRGVEAILDTTFLSVLATPFAAILGMITAWLVVRKKFTGKDVLDFTSNLGGAVPGTILGIGFILAFNKPPLALAIAIYAVLALFYAQIAGKNAPERVIILILGTALGVGLTKADPVTMYYVLGGLYLVMALIFMVTQKKISKALITALLGVYVMSTNWAVVLSKPIIRYSQSLERGFWSNAIFQFADYFKVVVQPNPSLLAVVLVFAGVILLLDVKGKGFRTALGVLGLAVPCALSFVGIPFAMVGGAYIIMAAFIVSSRRASVPPGVAGAAQ